MTGKKWKVFVAASVFSACMLTGCSTLILDGTKALEAGKYEDAEALFSEASQSEDAKMKAKAYRGLGLAYYEEERYAMAADAFRSALDNGIDKTAELYNMLGVCTMQAGDFKGALEYFGEGLALAESEEEKNSADPEMIREMKYNEIICCEKTADWELAKEKIAEYVEAYPDDESAKKEAEFLKTR